MGRCYIIFGRMPTLLPTSLTQRALPKSVQILWNKSFGIWHCWQQSEVRRNFHGLVFTVQRVIHYKALKTVESIDTGQTCWNVRLCYTLEICTLSFGLSLPRTFDPKTKTWVKSQTRPMTYPPIFHTHTFHIWPLTWLIWCTFSECIYLPQLHSIYAFEIPIYCICVTTCMDGLIYTQEKCQIWKPT